MAKMKEVLVLLKHLDEMGYTWNLKQTMTTGMGKIKYIQIIYDTRFNDVFSLKFYGGLHVDTAISEINGLRDWNCVTLALEWARLLHEESPEAAAKFLEDKEREGNEALMKEIQG